MGSTWGALRNRKEWITLPRLSFIFRWPRIANSAVIADERVQYGRLDMQTPVTPRKLSNSLCDL